ncbi:MAG: amidohydrolase [Longimicrobiales bacterium]
MRHHANPSGDADRVVPGMCLMWPAWLALLTACAGPPAADAPASADLVLLNGNVITVDAGDRIAGAVAVRDGKIVAVGTDREVEAFLGSGTSRIDLNGRTVTPGLLDSHAHFWSSGADRLYVADLSYPNVKSIEDVVAVVAEQVANLEPGEWVQGRGWDEGKLEELRYILASDLDPVAPENPVWLTHTMGHYGVANSLALEMADIAGSTADPAGGTIDRAPDGTPSGVLKESAQRLVSRMIPGFSDPQVKEGIRELARAFNQECMTGVKDLSVSSSAWKLYEEVRDEGDLNLRVFGLWSGGRSLEATAEAIENISASSRPYRSTGEDQLIPGGVKLYIDGSGGARTAWLYDEWNRDFQDIDEGNRGYPVVDPEMLREQIRMYHDAGIHVSVHAIGDRAIDWVVDSYWEALETNPTVGLRHGIIHANIPTVHAIELMAEMQRRFDAGYPEPQANFTWWIGDTYAGNFGPERALRLNPFRTFLEKGIQWGGGSDYPVTPFPARYGIWASIAREPVLRVYGEHPFGTAESVDVRTALRSFTMWAAHQMFLEDKVGSIEVGKYADLAVWDRDPYSVETDLIKDMRCEMTLFQGEIVYDASGSS